MIKYESIVNLNVKTELKMCVKVTSGHMNVKSKIECEKYKRKMDKIRQTVGQNRKGPKEEGKHVYKCLKVV